MTTMLAWGNPQTRVAALECSLLNDQFRVFAVCVSALHSESKLFASRLTLGLVEVVVGPLDVDALICLFCELLARSTNL